MSSTETTKPPVRLEWRMHVMMIERKIKTVTELRNRLEEIGVFFSSQQLNRIKNDFPELLNTQLLAGLLTVLECSLDDLIRVETRPAGEAASSPPPTPPKPKEPRKRQPERATGPIDKALGPKVQAFPRKQTD